MRGRKKDKNNGRRKRQTTKQNTTDRNSKICADSVASNDTSQGTRWAYFPNRERALRSAIIKKSGEISQQCIQTRLINLNECINSD